MSRGYIQSGSDDHGTQFKGLVSCRCCSCGDRFDRPGADIIQKSKDVKEIPYINEKKIIAACNKGDLSLLTPRCDSDWVFMKTYLCNECLHGFRKPVKSEKMLARLS